MSKLPDEVLERMARAHYEAEASKPDPHPIFMRWATWEQACKTPGFLDEKKAAMQAAWDASPGAELAAENKRLWIMLEDCVEEMDCLMRDSGGVYGLHLNGDNAPWGELSAGGRFEEWLSAHETARALLAQQKERG